MNTEGLSIPLIAVLVGGCFGETGHSTEPPRQTTVLSAPVTATAPKPQPPPPIPPSTAPASISTAPQTQVPHHPEPITVPGFHPASHVGPAVPPILNGRPIVVVLHGNYDRPEWQCGMWRKVADFHGWILCPRGIPTPWADPAEDRWMYRGSNVVSKEIEAAISSLKSRYPGQISDNGDRVLVGFSLGALLAPNIVVNAPNRYAYLFLIEGGAAKLDPSRIKALRRAGIRGFGLAASTGSNKRAAYKALAQLRRGRIPSVYVDMSGAGHNYRDDFSTTGRQALSALFVEADLQNGSSQRVNDHPTD